MKLIQYDKKTGTILKVISAPGAGQDIFDLYTDCLPIEDCKIVCDVKHKVDLNTLTIIDSICEDAL